MHNPPHPGLILREYLGDVSLSAFAACHRTNPFTLSRLLNGEASISPDMALRLARMLSTSPELWTNMQAQYDLWAKTKS
ncbi:MAG: HigA family addiction module antitoxin [Terriglobales bacterium]